MSKPYEKPRIISANEAIIAELRAENERLRSCLSDATENRRLIMGEYKQLREENERLRQELAIREASEQEKVIDYLSGQSVDWEDRYRALVSDNAKLCELVRDMWDVALHPQLFGDGSYLLRRMCDLGIEVG